MAQTAFFELQFLDVTGVRVGDPDVKIRFVERPSGRLVREFRGLSVSGVGAPVRFALPAFPLVKAVSCTIFASRFRTRQSEAFVLTDGETVGRSLTLFRRPDHWTARFDRWDSLDSRFEPLKQLLRNSPRVSALGGPVIGRPADQVYDGLQGSLLENAKASLLNLFAKLNELTAPTAPGRSWFSFVESVLVIGRERMIAVVQSKMGEAVAKIREDFSAFPDYKPTPAKGHFGNFPSAYKVSPGTLSSVKTKEDKGNLQLTLGRGRDPDTGGEVLLLDADIDENGKLFPHLLDVFVHNFRGGTHPFDIHEYLRLSRPDRPLGYQLV